MRIKNFKAFNEGFGDSPIVTKMPYAKTVFIDAMKDVDKERTDVDGSTLSAKVPQFDLLKTIIIILTDGNLMKQIFHMLPNVDLEKAMHNTSMLDNTQVDILNQIYNTIILNDYTLRKKYDMLPDNSQDIE